MVAVSISAGGAGAAGATVRGGGAGGGGCGRQCGRRLEDRRLEELFGVDLLELRRRWRRGFRGGRSRGRARRLRRRDVVPSLEHHGLVDLDERDRRQIDHPRRALDLGLRLDWRDGNRWRRPYRHGRGSGTRRVRRTRRRRRRLRGGRRGGEEREPKPAGEAPGEGRPRAPPAPPGCAHPAPCPRERECSRPCTS